MFGKRKRSGTNDNEQSAGRVANSFSCGRTASNGDNPRDENTNVDEIKAADKGTTVNKSVRRLHLRFTGQVQGVGFRWNAERTANSLGMTGWVRNEWDGSVTMELQGTNDQISEFFGSFNAQYRHYPIDYRIDDKTDIPTRDDEPGFAVKY